MKTETVTYHDEQTSPLRTYSIWARFSLDGISRPLASYDVLDDAVDEFSDLLANIADASDEVWLQSDRLGTILINGAMRKKIKQADDRRGDA